jgi:hypothetical protein
VIKTGMPEVDAAIAAQCEGAATVLGNQFVGMYLHGSLATGSFRQDISDIDFLIVTQGELPQRVVNSRAQLHRETVHQHSYWTRMLEGCYLPLRSIQKYDAFDRERPMIHKDRFYLRVPGYEWVLHFYVLRHFPTIVRGLSIAEQIAPIDRHQIKNAICHLIRERWVPSLTDPGQLRQPGSAAFAVLTMCRALVGMAEGAVPSKQEAANWVLANLPSRWHNLVYAASEWTWGRPLLDDADTFGFLRYSVERCMQQCETGA